MNKNKSIKSNVIYNTLLQLFNIAFPFITGAYVSRTVGAKNLGEINFSQSILSWIIVVAALGIPTYGVREIAKYRDDKNEMNKIFSELMVLRISVSIFLIAFYYISINIVPQFQASEKLFFITGLGLVFNLFSIDWFFSGIEDYKMISIRNIMVRIVTFALIVYFVKRESDYLIYALLLILSQGISNLWSYFYSSKFVKFSLRNLNCFRHIKTLKIFLASSLVVSVYTVLNSIILGFWGTSEGVAFFTRARQFQGMGLALTGAIATVLVPRISYYYQNDKEKYYELLDKSLNYNYIISIPITVGLIVLSKPLNLFLGGEQFIPAAVPLMIIAPLVIVISLGTWGYFQIIIPSGQEKFGTAIQIIMAVISLVLNILLIPKFGYIGASIALLAAEGVGPFISFYLLRKKIKFRLITDSLFKYLIAGLGMSVTIWLLMFKLQGINLILGSGIVGLSTYGIILILLKEKLVFEIFMMILKKIKK